MSLIEEIEAWEKSIRESRPKTHAELIDEQHREELDRQWQEKFGYTHTEWLEKMAARSQSNAQLEQRQKKALTEGVPLEELPIAMEPDEYYDWQASYGGEPSDDVDYSSGYDFNDF